MPASLPRSSTSLTCFDGSARVDATVVRPDRQRHWAALTAAPHLTVRGGGYSYAPAQIGDDTLHVDMRAWNHVIDFDRERGVLTVEGGITLGDVHHLATPGRLAPACSARGTQDHHRRRIAGDVHGKNQHHVGNFRHCVRALDVWHPDHGEQHAVRGDELFELTAGGLGLTGVILRAELQLAALPSSSVLVTPIPIEDAADTVRALRADPESLFSYTWQNFTRRTARWSRRGVVGALRRGRFAVGRRRLPGARPTAPRLAGGAMKRPSIWALNTVYGALLARSRDDRKIDMLDFLFPAARRATYFKLFGSAGFHESQILVGHDVLTAFLEAVAELARRRRAPVSLASAKLFAGEASCVRFDGDGVALAVDAPRSAAGTSFIADVHHLMLEAGGRPNLLKDSLISRETAEASVAGLEEFRARLHTYDPKRRFRSVLSDRIGL